ncbi:MAG: efflux RND transporter periplasmic adaptor subunit [Burkholderiales bacterium]|nr:efflux RND transporter periplasmic adaptor subunit [Burkholderiales bacterium]
MPTTSPTPTTPATASSRRRRSALLGIAAVVLLAGLAYGVYWVLWLRNSESTDNAYVQAPLVQITPQIGGTAIEIAVDDTERVRPGQVLVRLDPGDARLALTQAEAQLAQTVRDVRGLYANDGTLEAQIALRRAELQRAQTELAKAQDDVARRRPLVTDGAVGREEFQHAERALEALRGSLAAAQAAVTAAQAQLAANRVQTGGVALERHPAVLRAAAAVREAHLTLQRTTLRAPVDGVVARRTVQLGQRVAAGSPLMAVVALDQLWVDANFKEGQLRDIRIGQPAEASADQYGHGVVFHGRVIGLGAGTGAAFALLPAQNATGNWIKVVQRVPVRIALDARDLAAHPLRVGLSMEVKVDTRRTDGPTLGSAPSSVSEAPAASVAAAASAASAPAGAPSVDEAAADADVQRIIARNGGTTAASAAGAGHARSR